MREEWREIEGYSRYLISNYGRIWSKTRVVSTANKSIKTIRKGAFKNSRNKDGYMVVNLVPDGEIRNYKTVRMHRLIAQAFIPNPSNFKIVHHKNSIRNDNRIENLEWTSSSQNNTYRWQDGNQEENREKARRICKINGQKGRVISLKTKIEIIKSYKMKNKTQKEIGKEYGVSSSVVSFIVNGKYFNEDDITKLTKLMDKF